MSAEDKLRVTVIALGCSLFVTVLSSISSYRETKALETRLSLVESNSVETVQIARKAQADLGRLSEAVLLWRMSLPTNRISVITNAAPTP